VALFPIAGKLVSINLIEVLDRIIHVGQSFPFLCYLLLLTAQHLDFIYWD